ncbi:MULTISPECIES: ABC transporter ATP-binding protein [unclassified Streptomyces]|uniref:ABC transporter ATP-binding protein n=1 Tax=unclassified Streptomyces TaxID=2593676 RepID=UPI002DDAB72F|nr:ABC transporter ATP-binding protein [Streptomyces sp. NBC_01445]WSE02647.1 ABC transporter ATP-binding protein [Streptomyces sp. NBC_01445]
MTEMALATDALGKRYGRTWALQECSLHLPAGRIAGLAGPNGAGKSTLLHLAVGMLRPDAGQVRVFGQDPRNNTAVLREVGFVAQDTPLYREFTAADHITLGGRLNSRWDAAFARERIDQLDIPFKKPVGKLSGGQRAQVALALAMAKRPRLLLLDEPVAALDPLARREFVPGPDGASGPWTRVPQLAALPARRPVLGLPGHRDGRLPRSGGGPGLPRPAPDPSHRLTGGGRFFRREGSGPMGPGPPADVVRPVSV